MTGRLKSELKKKGEFDSLEQEATLNLWRTSDQLVNRMGQLLRQFGLTPSQYNVLRILRGAGNALPSLEIASRLIQVVPAITGLIDRLEQQRLVERERSGGDRRVVNVTLTKKGSELLAKIDEPLQDLHHRLMSQLTRSELITVIELMEKIRS